MPKATLSEENKKAFILSLYDAILAASEVTTDGVMFNHRKDFKFRYLSEEKISDSEKEIIKKISEIPNVEQVLKKIISDGGVRVIFSLLNIIDGMGYPNTKYGDWTGVALADADQVDESGDMFHDSFLEMYHEWKNIK